MGKASRLRKARKAEQLQQTEHGPAVGSGVRSKDLDLSAPGDAYTGTFRWAASKRFMQLPDPPELPAQIGPAGWAGFLRSRCPADPEICEKVRADPSVLDGLTFPISLVHMLRLARFPMDKMERAGLPLRVVVLGAAGRCEERLARQTEYWGEISSATGLQVQLVLVGPEISEDAQLTLKSCAGTSIQLVRGTYTSYAQGRQEQPGTVLVTYNGGFGNWVESNRFELLLSWFEDLCAMVESDLPAFFCQANDYADLVGEMAIMSSAIQADLVLAPQRNPFQAATHLSEPNNPESWACANSSFFAVQGGRLSPGLVGLDQASRQQRLIQLVLQRAAKEFVDLAAKPLRVAVDDRAASTKHSAGRQPKYSLDETADRVTVCVELPLLERASAVEDVGVVGPMIELTFAHSYAPLKIPLKDEISEDAITARFDISSKILMLNVTKNQ